MEIRYDDLERRKFKMKQFVSLSMALLMISLSISGCGAASDVAVDAAVVSEGNNYDAHLVITQATDMISWDPIATSDMPNSTILFTVYARLFKSDPDFRPLPELCKEYTQVSPTEWHFTIYDNIYAHDGSHITADDVIFNLNRAADGVTLGALFNPVTSITQVDDFTISITTDGPYPGLVTALSHVATSILPRSFVEQAVANDDWSHPIGTGKYIFESRVIGDSVTVVRNEDYFKPEERAKNASLTFTIIPEGTSRTIAVETGEVDLNIDFETNDFDRVIDNPDLKLWEEPTTQNYFLGMDVTVPYLNNPLVRQAINFAVDRYSALEVALNGRGGVVYNNANFAPTILGAVNNPLDHYSFDPDRARELMAEAGVSGFDTELFVYTEVSERAALVVQANLADIGINVSVQRVEDAAFYARAQENQAPMFIDTWACYWDPDLFLVRRFTEAGFGGVNRSWYSNPELDRKLDAAREAPTLEERAELYREIQEFMVFEAPQADLFFNNAFALTRAGLQGVIVGSERVSFLDQLHY